MSIVYVYHSMARPLSFTCCGSYQDLYSIHLKMRRDGHFRVINTFLDRKDEVLPIGYIFPKDWIVSASLHPIANST